ncbi:MULTISPECIES: hypothetical protein [unclassified Arthrobacter]|uniref:hypothetical protein n=1 Tax=unclassified Arthrobacter TaxID=235627 RepID=UPI0006F2EBCE|nr:hypothetical protein [Arthrobacter sp. Soil764]
MIDPAVQKLLVDRPYFYATGMERTVHAYTKDEWGIGGSQPSGNYSVHTTTGLVVVTALMTIPALGAPLMLIIALASLNLILVIFGLLGTVLFTGGWLLGIGNLRRELRATKKRKLKGLPKPRFALTDDQARAWFESNPPHIAITRENFPDSTRPFPGDAPPTPPPTEEPRT